MKSLGSFLSRFSAIAPPDDAVRRAVVEIILETAGFSIPMENIAVKNGIIWVRSKPIKKSEIMLKRNIILEKLYALFGAKTLRDIR